MPIKLTGEKELRRALKNAGPLAHKAMAAAAVEEMETVMAEAKRRTPVDTGTLRASGVVKAELGSQQTKVLAGFGGAAEDYAIVQHEDLTLSHPSGEAKFLERPFLERSKQMPRSLAAGIKRALERLR